MIATCETGRLWGWIGRKGARATPRWVGVVLRGNHAWAWRFKTGETLRCTDGQLWLTQCGVAGDRVLKAGETYHAPRGGKVVVTALGEGQFVYCPR